jgi:16S rRNA (cytosine1402-N4)-methyltransferase
LLCLDRDSVAVAEAKERFAADPRVTIHRASFSALGACADQVQPGLKFDGILFDLGVSSPQLDDPRRGFSFRADGPLDMRMGSSGSTAADLVNTLPEAALSKLIYVNGEERFSRRVARAIAAARQKAPLTRTTELAELVRAVVPAGDGIDPATRTFQALRIEVNDELGELERALHAAERLLAAGGRLAIVSFHSLEDRRVKDFLRERSPTAPRGSRHRPDSPPRPPSFRLLTRKPVTSSAAEIARNPRARSARLRAAERTSAPPWASSEAA